MIPRNRRGLVCRGLYKLKKELRKKEYRAVYKNGWWSMVEVKG